MIESPVHGAAAPSSVVPVRRHRGLLTSERRLLLVAGDSLAVALAYVAAFNIRTAEVRNAGFYVPRSGTLIAVAAWLVAAHLVNAYDFRNTARVRDIIRVVGGAVAISLVILLLVFFAVPYRITRPTILLWGPLAAVAVTSVRVGYRRTLRSSRLAHQVALVATPAVLERTWPDVRANCGDLYHVRQVVNPESPAAASRLAELARSGAVGEVVVGVDDEISRDLFRSLVACYDSGLTVRTLADLYEELTGRLLLGQLGNAWLTSLPMRSETSRIYAACKRGVDLVAGAMGMVALGALLVVVAPLVKLDDRGPLFHRQRRVGKYGVEFELTKLRTMRVAKADDTHWTEAGDNRITRVGRVLRRLHLDELPQMWNILHGDMSLIGPRPEQPHYVAELRDQVDLYNTRLTVRPGLTGWAQVNFGYGSGIDGARVKLSYDLYYIKRQSLSLDVLVMARTALAMLSLNGR